MSNYLLSICIPTYNRAEILDQTLAHLLGDPDFDPDLTEVVVSDNASDDLTPQVAAKYSAVRYHRNEENIRDANFTVVLGLATGQYLKLFNDTVRLRPGMLRRMLDELAACDPKRQNVLFYNNCFCLSDSAVELTSSLELLRSVSFYTTWIANFGIWREDFERLGDKNRFVKTQFLQVDWSYRMVGNGKHTKVVACDFFDISLPAKKGGYNVFDTFVNKYLPLIKSMSFGQIAYQREKYRLMRYFIVPFYLEFRHNQEVYDFDLSRQNGTIFKSYRYTPYFYAFVTRHWRVFFKKR